MRKKKLMILGAGIYQVPLIKKAKQMGLYVIVLSYQGKYPGFVWADKVYYVDTTDIEQVIEIAKKECIDGICTTGTDVAMITLGKVVDELGLNGVSYNSAILTTNKSKMKKIFNDHDVRTARFIMVSDIATAYKAFNELGESVIFKAVDSSGSRGIIKVHNCNMLEYAYNEVKKVTKLDYFIVEEFINGVEFGAQAFVCEGELKFILPHGDMLFFGDAAVPIGHFVPYNLPESIVNDMVCQLKKSIFALRLDNCAINADFMLKDNEVYVLEIGARAGATCLPELVSTYYGIDYYESIINVALGEEIHFKLKLFKPCACELLLSDKDGYINSIENNIIKHQDIIDISFDYGIGDKVNKFKCGPDRIGQIIVKGEGLELAMAQLDVVKKNIRIEIID